MAVVARATKEDANKKVVCSDEKFSLEPERGAPRKAKFVGTEEGNDLFQSLNDSRPWFRAKALHELGKLGEWGAECYGNADKAAYMLEDPSAQVQVAALLALGQMGCYGAAYGEFIVQRAEQGFAEREVRRAAIRALGTLGEHAISYVATVEDSLEDECPDIVATACVALGALRGPAPRLIERLRAGDVEVVVAACKGLGLLATGSEELASMFDHQEARVRAVAVAALGKEPIGASRHLRQVVRLVGDPDAHVRIAAANLIVAVGEKAAAHAALLGDLLERKEPGVRAAAATALGGLGAKAASEVPRLEKLLADGEEDKSTLLQAMAGMAPKVPPTFRKPACAAAAALAVIGEAAHGSAALVADGLDSFDEEVRIQCACALTGLGAAGARHEDRVLSLLDDPQPLVVASACYSLGSMAETTKAPSATVAQKVVGCLSDKHPAVRGAAVQGLGKMGDEASTRIQSIARCLKDQIGHVRSQALGAIASLAQSEEIGQMLAPEVCRLMFDQEVRVRLAAVQALPKLGHRGAAFTDEVACLMDDPWPEVRVAGLKALGEFGAKAIEKGGHLPTILQVADGDYSPEVRQAAQEAANLVSSEDANTLPPRHPALEDNTDGDDEFAAQVGELLGISLQEAVNMSEEEMQQRLGERATGAGAAHALGGVPLESHTEE